MQVEKTKNGYIIKGADFKIPGTIKKRDEYWLSSLSEIKFFKFCRQNKIKKGNIPFKDWIQADIFPLKEQDNKRICFQGNGWWAEKNMVTTCDYEHSDTVNYLKYKLMPLGKKFGSFKEEELREFWCEKTGVSAYKTYKGRFLCIDNETFKTEGTPAFLVDSIVFRKDDWHGTVFNTKTKCFDEVDFWGRTVNGTNYVIDESDLYIWESNKMVRICEMNDKIDSAAGESKTLKIQCRNSIFDYNLNKISDIADNEILISSSLDKFWARTKHGAKLYLNNGDVLAEVIGDVQGFTDGVWIDNTWVKQNEWNVNNGVVVDESMTPGEQQILLNHLFQKKYGYDFNGKIVSNKIIGEGEGKLVKNDNVWQIEFLELALPKNENIELNDFIL